VWVKASAVNPAVEETAAEIVVLHDADVWCGGVSVAVDAVAEGAPWAVPHRLVHRLTELGTAAVLDGDAFVGQSLIQAPYQGVAGGGIIVAPRDTLQRVPLDPRFQGWGQEDEAHAFAMRSLVGDPWRGRADLFHLFHPPQPRWTRRRGSPENWRLRGRYLSAKRDPRAMGALIDEIGS
jgi:hypothetical protein